jgi:hypothetical protein
MAIWWVWAAAAALYALFLAWYVNWRGALTPSEVESLLAKIRGANPEAAERNTDGTIRAFLEADDGREFFMLNLVKLSPTPVPHPVTGAPVPAREALNAYTGVFLPALFRRGGHPAIAARKVGGYVDAWGVEADPGWSIVGYMRYRSRRDLAHLASDPRFGSAHDFKFAAMPATFSFPTQPIILGLLSPRIWVGLLLAALAGVTQAAMLALA